jgi:hypothetical protein
MFDGAHLGTVTFETRAHARVANHKRRGREINDRIEIDAAKHDSRIRSGRPQGHVDLDARVKAYARGADEGFEAALSQHVTEKVGKSANCNTAVTCSAGCNPPIPLRRE